MADVGDAVGQGDDPPLGREGAGAAGVVPDAVDDLAREVEAAPVALQKLDDARALLVVGEQSLRRGRVGVDAAVARDGMAERTP